MKANTYTRSQQRYRGILAYDGTAYQGYQRQRDGVPTIQGKLEAAIARITRQPVTVYAAGRTDSGVHASGQVIAFDVTWKHQTEALLRAINANLPSDIALRSLEKAPSGFHPRFDAVSRRYVYRFYADPIRNPLWDRMVWQVRTPLQGPDLKAMQTAAAQLIGTHDFATFGNAPEANGNTARTVYQAQFSTVPEGWHELTIEGNAFLTHMVRSLMGTLVDVGRGKHTPDDFAEALIAADRTQAGTTAPPHGLILVHVNYCRNNLPEIK